MVSLAALLIGAVAVPPALAKRTAPKPVPPLRKDGIEYSAPVERMGFVVATWVQTKREIWGRQVYVIKHEYQHGLEQDVQTCFINGLHWAGAKLIVTNERDGEFELDPEALTVTVRQGSLVVDYSGKSD